jgi:STAS-like domain of unknown function (DUF4325)
MVICHTSVYLRIRIMRMGYPSRKRTERITPMTETIRLGEIGRVFATRHMGRWFRERAEALPAGEAVTLDWTGVEVITGSFADELVGKLAGTREVVSTGACAEVRETLDLALRRRATLAEGFPS